VRGYEPSKNDPDWISHSGDEGSSSYGHGGYEAIKSGNAKVYSLRDPKGESHATIEVAKTPLRTWDDVTKAVGKEKASALHKEFYDIGADRTDDTEAAMAMFLKNKGVQPVESITQIKGKQNAAPNENYQPYVQDFVKSGQWSGVGDLRNTGLMDVKFMTNPDVYKNYLERGLKVPKYATEKELDALHNEYLRLAEPRNYKPPEEGMAEGGGAFKKISFYDKGGITTSGGTFSPEELGVSAEELGISDKRLNQIKRNAAGLLGEGKEQLEQEYKQATGKGGRRDAAIRIGSQFLGGGVDLANMGLEGLDLLQSVIPSMSKPESVLDTAGTGDRVPKFKLATDEPFLGSQHFLRKFKEAKLLGENEFPLTEAIAGFAGPAVAVGALKKGKQAYQGAKALVDKPKKRQGGLTAMAR
jgi:hypothetical protein